MAVTHFPTNFGAKNCIQSGVIDIFRNSRWRPTPSWIFSLCEFGHSGMLIVWCLCCVPNLVQISVIVTEIDALILQNFIWWRHAINFRFRLLVTWSSPHGCDASSQKIWCRYLSPIRSYWHFAEIKDGGRRHLGFVGGAMGPPTKAHSWCVLPVKMSSWSDQ